MTSTTTPTTLAADAPAVTIGIRIGYAASRKMVQNMTAGRTLEPAPIRLTNGLILRKVANVRNETILLAMIDGKVIGAMVKNKDASWGTVSTCKGTIKFIYGQSAAIEWLRLMAN